MPLGPATLSGTLEPGTMNGSDALRKAAGFPWGRSQEATEWFVHIVHIHTYIYICMYVIICVYIYIYMYLPHMRLYLTATLWAIWHRYSTDSTGLKASPQNQHTSRVAPLPPMALVEDLCAPSSRQGARLPCLVAPGVHHQVTNVRRNKWVLILTEEFMSHQQTLEVVQS